MKGELEVFCFIVPTTVNSIPDSDRRVPKFLSAVNTCELTGSTCPLLIFFLHLLNMKDGKDGCYSPLGDMSTTQSPPLTKMHAVMQSFYKLHSSLSERALSYPYMCLQQWLQSQNDSFS